MSEFGKYFRGYFDVYFISLAVMNERQQMGQVVHEGLLFEEVNRVVKYDYISGFNAIKHQIMPSMRAHKVDLRHIEKYTFDLLNRTCSGWMREPK